MRFLFPVIVLSLAASSAALADDSGRRATPARASAVCASTDSARLTIGNGVALVSRGGSFAEIHDGAELVAGDRVLIRGGSARLIAGGQVMASAGAGSLLTLDRKDGKLCVARASSHPAAIGAAGTTSNDRDCDLTGDKKRNNGDPTDNCLLILGGAVAAGGIAGGVLAATSDSGGGGKNVYYVSPQ